MKRKKSAGRKSLPQRQFTDAELAALNPDEHADLFRKVGPEDPLFKSDVLPQARRTFSYVEGKEGTWRSALPRAFYLLEDAMDGVAAILTRAPQPPTSDSADALAKFVNAVHEWGTALLNAVRPRSHGTGGPLLTIAGLFKPAPDSAESGLPPWTTLGDSLTPFLGEIPEELRPLRQLALLQHGLDSLIADLKKQDGPPCDTPGAASPGYIKLIGRSVVMALQGLAARLLAWLTERVATFKDATLPRFEFTDDTGLKVAVTVVVAGHERRSSLTHGSAQFVRELFSSKRAVAWKKYKSAVAKALPELEPFISPVLHKRPSRSMVRRSNGTKRKSIKITYRLDPALSGRLAVFDKDGKRIPI